MFKASFRQMARNSSRILLLALLIVLIPFVPASAQGRGGRGQQPEPEPLKWRFMGASVGNRIAAVAGVPSDPNIYYAGAASGGVWKSTDGGATFAPIFDGMRVAAIGALAVAPTDPKIVWAGTGEAWAIRPSDVIGDGIYKSEDAGMTWTHLGLDETGRIGRIIVHPTDANVVYACALGRLSGPQRERGVFKTTDGGRTWNRVLFADENTGCSGLTMDPKDPNVLFAGMWQVEMHPRAMLSRRSGQRHLCHARRGREVDEGHPSGFAKVTSREDRRRNCADGLEPRLRADSDRRSRFSVAIRRRWRLVEGGELGSRAHRPRRLLHPARDLARQRR
jgi:hypothetical protein